MNTLLRLPLTLLELTVREGLKAARGVLARVGPGTHPDDVRVAPIAEPAPVSPEVSTVAAYGPAREVVTRVKVRPPWAGYDSDTAMEIARRVSGADDATKAVVLLYEEHHRRRSTVLDAART